MVALFIRFRIDKQLSFVFPAPFGDKLSKKRWGCVEHRLKSTDCVFEPGPSEVWKEVTTLLRYEKLEWKCDKNSKDQEEPSPITG
jgi:hypothetical protein